MADRIDVTHVQAQIEYQVPPKIKVNQAVVQVEYPLARVNRSTVARMGPVGQVAAEE